VISSYAAKVALQQNTPRWQSCIID